MCYQPFQCLLNFILPYNNIFECVTFAFESVTSTSSAFQSSPVFDTVIELYWFGKTKNCSKRNTIVWFNCLSSHLNEAKKALHKQHGLEDDAYQAHIGLFTIDWVLHLGVAVVHKEQPTFIAQSEEEWSNVTARLQSQLQHYQLLGE